jgi:hypothetical protein
MHLIPVKVVANNFAFGDVINNALLRKLHRELRPGALVLTVRDLLPQWVHEPRR